MITVAVQMFLENEKKLDSSNQINKGYEEYIDDNKIKNDFLDNVWGDNLENTWSERDVT